MKNFLKENWGVTLLFILIISFLFWPVLFGGKIFPDKFAVMYHYPAFKFFGETLQTQNSFPVLMPGYLSGFPVYLSQIGFLHPAYIILFKFLNYVTAYNWQIFLNLLIGMLATYIFAKNLNLSKPSAIIASVAYSLNQWNISASQINAFSNLIPVLPLVFLSILKIHRGRKIYILLGASTLAIGLTTTSNQIMLYILTALLFFSIFLDAKKIKEKSIKMLGDIKRFGTTGWSIIMIILSSVLTSIWILPVLQFKTLTHRASADFFEMNWKNSANIGDFVRFFYPSFDFGGITGRAPIYIGTLAFFLGIVAIIWLRKNGMIKFFTFLFLFTFLASFKYSPLMWIINQLPFFNLFRFPTKWMYVGNFALALLAAFGFEYLHEIREKTAFKKFIKLTGIFAIVATVLVISANFMIISSRSWIIGILKKYFNSHIYEKTAQAPLEYYYKVIEQKLDYIASNIWIGKGQVIASLSFLAISAIFLYFYQKRGIYKNLAVAIIILNILIVWKFDDITNFLPREFTTKPPKIAEFILKQKLQNQPFRIYRFFPPLRPTEYAEFGFIDFEADPTPKDTMYIETLEPNTHILYDIDSIDGHEVFQNKRYSRVLSMLGATNAISDGSVPGWETMENWISKKLTLKDKLKIFQSEKNRGLLSMMNVKYILSPFEFPSPWKKVFETEIAKDAKSQKFYIYENPDVMPKLYFASRVEFTEPDEIKAFEALMENSDFREKTLIEIPVANNSRINREYPHESDLESPPPISSPSERGRIKERVNYSSPKTDQPWTKNNNPNQIQEIFEINIQESRSGYLRLTTNASSPRWLVYSQNNLPSWEAKIDGKPIQIYAANYIYQTVFIPEGEHKVEFKYPGPWEQFVDALKAMIMQ